MPILVDGDNWAVEEGEFPTSYRLFRTYYLSDQLSRNIAAAIRFVFTFEGDSNLYIQTGLYTFVRPMPLQEKRTFLLGLHSARQGGTSQVVAIPNTENNPFWLDAYLCVEPDAALTCLGVFLVGSEITFSLSVPADLESWSLTTNPRSLLKAALPNGPEFYQRYREICCQIERTQRIARNRELIENWPLRVAK